MEPYLIEVSSEAGRKVGGIYTVLRSKARYVSKHFPNRYLFIGFYDERCAHDVKFSQPPPDVKQIFTQLSALGIFCHYGHWLYGANTPIILVDAKNFGERHVQYNDGGKSKHDLQSNYIKFLLWKNFGIDSLMEKSYDFSENIVWGWAVGMLLEKLCKIKPYSSHSLIAHFHEWISGGALLYARMNALPIATVFTTHATVLGRTLSTSGVDVLEKAQSSAQPIELSQAYKMKVEGKHQLEMAASKKCHVFTTVSETVAQEVRYILGRYPDVIVLNGMDFEHEIAEAQVRDISKYVRRELLQLTESVFNPYHIARYDNALLVFTSGRYEFKNKGFDIFINALGKLNEKIKKKGMKKQKQVVAFIFAPSSIKGPKISVIKNYLLIDKMKEVLDAAPGASRKKHYANVKERIEDVKGSLKRDLNAMYSSFIKDRSTPPISLFDLNYANDEVINSCISAGLKNSKQDAVKVLFYPSYLRPSDGLLNMGYYDVISGMDMGVFASRYEPFGYTPLEAGLKLNIAVSTDAAGFGRYLLSKENLEGRGGKNIEIGRRDFPCLLRACAIP
ncbi:MAG: glycogen/starch synthase [Candidatus Micrarchaeota archaeon]